MDALVATPTIAVSPPPLRTRVSFNSMQPKAGLDGHSTGSGGKGSGKGGRSRSSSLLSVHEIRDNYDDQLDQGVGPNFNAEWVHHKGPARFPASSSLGSADSVALASLPSQVLGRYT